MLTTTSSRSAAILHQKTGWAVVIAGVGINLVLGVLYSWSVLSKKIPADWNWTEADRSMPYSVACLVISIAMVPAGRMQDRFGPRLVATIGGVLGGAGMILASFSNTPFNYTLGFGVLVGAGVGFAYSSTTPAAMKWFPSSRTGLIAGIVIGAYGLASVYIAPLAEALINRYGVPATMFWLGLGLLCGVTGLAQFLKTPPPGHRPEAAQPLAEGVPATTTDFTPYEVLQTWQFYALWFLYACGSGAGLMIISKLAKMVDVQAGLKPGFLLVACLALGNGGGRFLAGAISDKIGRRATLFACFLMLAALIFLLSLARAGNALGTMPALVVLSTLIGANYGANLSLFPTITKDFYGLRHFGTNYGLLFTSWGLSGFVFSLLAGRAFDLTKTFAFAYESSVTLLLAAAAVTFLISPPRHPQHESLSISERELIL
jgi:MFS transporter, OFA family, oxalate/formate antiporter